MSVTLLKLNFFLYIYTLIYYIFYILFIITYYIIIFNKNNKDI
nr:MAG TPA: hypothetical protein [Caudoviricetes sp.]